MLLVFFAAIFASATLLFVVQPMFSRMMMPLLGGSTSVWVTSMVFYQTVLLLGYVYSHKISGWLSGKNLYLFHILIVLLPLAVLPLDIPQDWSPSTASHPIPSILLLLLMVVGLPFFVLSTNSPLIQLWFSKTGHQKAHDPYFLYAASNIGSMLGLIGYPLFIEPYTSVAFQANLWLGGYLLFASLVIVCAVVMIRFERKPIKESQTDTSALLHGNITRLNKLKWVFWAFIPSSLMIGMTSYLSNNTDVYLIPFFWVLPLAVYLLSFIVVFAKHNLVPPFVVSSPLSVILLVFILISTERYYDFNPVNQLFLHITILFIICVACHKVIADLRPQTNYLTDFYIWMSVGGILGGVFNSLLAPFLFATVFEFWLILFLFMLAYALHSKPENKHVYVDSLIGACLLMAVLYIDVVLMDFDLLHYTNITLMLVLFFYTVLQFTGNRLLRQSNRFVWIRRLPALPVYGLALFVMSMADWFLDTSEYAYVKRSFYGVSKVGYTEEYVKIYHGNTSHGAQHKHPARRYEPTSYYHRNGPLGDFFSRTDLESDQWSVGVVGLGAGGMLPYSKPEQDWTYFEIDPVVVEIANDTENFSYVSTYQPKIILGDGRVSLKQEADDSYDVLIMDAYSAGSIPIHLMTLEAVQLYLSKLKTKGYILFHVSNRHLELEYIVGNIAAELGLNSLVKRFSPDHEEQLDGAEISTWVVITRQELDAITLGENWHDLDLNPDYPTWSDAKSSLLSVVKWGNL